jgi:hypothetical protein
VPSTKALRQRGTTRTRQRRPVTGLPLGRLCWQSIDQVRSHGREESAAIFEQLTAGHSGENGVMIAMSPQGPVELPRIVTEFAAGRPTRAVWKNELGGLTFQVGVEDARQFVKWTPADSGIDLSAEVARLRWAARFVVVPRVLDAGADGLGSWIIMTDGRLLAAFGRDRRQANCVAVTVDRTATLCGSSPWWAGPAVRRRHARSRTGGGLFVSLPSPTTTQGSGSDDGAGPDEP